MKRLSLLFALCTATATLTGCFAAAQPGEQHAMRDGYTYLGETYVMGGNDHNAIEVGRSDGRFSAIMVVVENAPVEIYNMVVVFGDGQRWEPGTRMTFGPDSTTRQIPLPGGLRHIRHVDFHYGNFAGQGQAKVELWGK